MDERRYRLKEAMLTSASVSTGSTSPLGCSSTCTASPDGADDGKMRARTANTSISASPSQNVGVE
jgi:hypothetical protein